MEIFFSKNLELKNKIFSNFTNSNSKIYTNIFNNFLKIYINIKKNLNIYIIITILIFFFLIFTYLLKKYYLNSKEPNKNSIYEKKGSINTKRWDLLKIFVYEIQQHILELILIPFIICSLVLYCIIVGF